MQPTFRVQLKIQKPVAEVFEAVVNPQKLAGYFVQKASAPLAKGTTVLWQFVEVPGEHPVQVREVIANEQIVLEWDASDGDYRIQVQMVFKPLDGGNTLLQIAESGWRETPEGRKGSYENCGGWMHMAACLKAYLEYGVNLRAGGAF